METVGQILSSERNCKNLSINDIAAELKISKNIIIDTDIRCPDIVEPIRSNIYFSDAEDDECLDNWKTYYL